ncbi:MAG: 2-oxoacid:acceptor oxidoreductase family protein [Candidatus Aminicenantes bacterium]|nr:2-oxoacid:acceptor oxidoreductase family protein [Candidatus Aminicenantes bacterium]
MSMILDDPLNIVIAGVGGQGNVLSARILGRTLMKKDYFVSIVDSFGSTQRGGSVHSSIRAGRTKCIETVIPKGLAHVIVSLEPLETLRMLQAYGNPGTLTLTNMQPVLPPEVLAGKQDYPEVNELRQAITELSQKSWFLDASDIAIKVKAPVAANIVMLGALIKVGLVPVRELEIEEEIKEYFSGRKAEFNLRAFRSGMEAVQGD